MGDTGSLTIGGIIAVSAIIIHKELLLPLICGVFLWESMSVILQKLYYKKGRKIGKPEEKYPNGKPRREEKLESRKQNTPTKVGKGGKSWQKTKCKIGI